MCNKIIITNFVLGWICFNIIYIYLIKKLNLINKNK